MQSKPTQRLALFALFGGATGIGFAPILVRLSEVGPSATAFYRLLFALPLLWLAMRLDTDSERPWTLPVPLPNDSGSLNANPGRQRLWQSPRSLCVLAGFLFAGDLAFWHWSIKLTSVANSTLLTNCAPFFVVLGARVLFCEKIRSSLVWGILVACIGSAMLVGASLQLTARHLIGDFLALVTAVFYGSYLLTVKHLRISLSTARVLAWSGLVSCALLLIIALLSQEVVWSRTGRGWMVLLALGLISHIGGQGLIAYALAHLPAGFSSVGLLFQPVVATALAWWILSEPLSTLQGVGGTIVLAGIALATCSQILRHAR